MITKLKLLKENNMTKLVLIPALLLGTLAMAEQHKYEISPMIGYDLTEGNIGIKGNGYPVGGLEVQINTPNSRISPEFSVLYSSGVDYSSGGNTRIVRGAFNGVYSFDAMNSIFPFAKIGVGVEAVQNETLANQDGFFMDAGAGAKVALTENIALKLEAMYLAKVATQNAGFADSNLIAMVGVTFAFGGDKREVAPEPTPEPEAKVEAVVVAPVAVDGDDDKDGVANSIDECVYTPAETPVDSKGCALDDDKDGVINSLDKCPTTPLNASVDAKGCELDDDNDGVANSLDECLSTVANAQVDAKGCELDSDNDGVLNSKDMCKDTAANTEVDSDGCAKTITIELEINFENNSDKVKSESIANVDAYADFLNASPNYSAKIIGYTDSVGNASYNKKLSQKRAESVKKMLLDRGVNSTQVTAVGLGKVNPIADNATAEGRAKNRRIEAELTKN